MELFKLSVLAFALYMQLDTGVSSLSENMDNWFLENWLGDPAKSGFKLHFDDLLKHSKTQQFHGLMGRSLENNGEMFVGLMGKRPSKEDFEAVPDKPQ